MAYTEWPNLLFHNESRPIVNCKTFAGSLPNNKMGTACEPSGKLCKHPDFDFGTLYHECPLEAKIRASCQ